MFNPGIQSGSPDTSGLPPHSEHRFWRYGPLILWAALIFIGSGNVLSATNTSIVVRVAHWLFPQASDATLANIHFIVRKCGHLTEYGILGLITAVFGLIAGIAASYGIITGVMRLPFAMDWSVAATSITVALLVTVILGLVGTWRILGQKPAPYLREL